MRHDVTLINMNIMYAIADGRVDFQVYNPLGLLSIASCLDAAGYAVDFRDYQLLVRDNLHDPFNLEQFIEFVDGSANIVGFSCMANLLPFALLAAKRLKELAPKTTVILGGVGPTGVPREIIENFDWVDYVCCGEGEQSMVELMNKLKTRVQPGSTLNNPVPGLFSRNGGLVTYVPRPRIANLDSLPLPAYNLIDFKDYDGAFSVLTSRGCPYRCAFCTETNHWNNHVVFRGIEKVLEEIKFIAEHSSKRVFLFQDDQITLDRERAKILFHRMIEEDLDMLWKCFVRVDLIDAELLALMEEAGCVQVRFGVESGSNRILQAINKGFTIEQAYRAVCLALDYIPSVHASLIWGFPFETIAECEETMEWARRFQDIGCTVLNFLLSPLPNSEIYRNYRGPLDFNTDMMANFNISGAENLRQGGTRIIKNAQYLFDFIREYPHIFPGFYLYDYENNVRPKMRIVHKDRCLVFPGVRRMKVGEYEDVDL